MKTVEMQYFEARKALISHPETIIEIEQEYTERIVNDVILPTAEQIRLGFSESPYELLPFWINYPPEQRGNKPKMDSVPWLELGEKVIVSNILPTLAKQFPHISFPGVPTGSDIRFQSDNVFVHLDVKLTGPNDNSDEIVVPPNQVSGDGSRWGNNGIINSSTEIKYQSRSKVAKVNYQFQPKLPPLYIMHGKPLLCITLFLEASYQVRKYGDHPLSHLELSCVPNGLLMFDGPRYCETKGLLIAGKDDKKTKSENKRIRIRLLPLSRIGDWRSVIISKEDRNWLAKKRL